MGIKSEIESKSHLDFPKLMTNSHIVVMFEEYGYGTIVKGSPIFKTGSYSSSWDMDEFYDFNGTVTLSNEV